MNNAQITAFKTAVGGTGGGYVPSDFAALLALIAAGALLTWGAFIVAKLGDDFLRGRITVQWLFAYKVRVLVLILLTVYLLH